MPTTTKRAARIGSKAAAILHVVKVIHEHLPLDFTTDGLGETFGQQIDRRMYEAAMSFDEIQSMEFEVSPEAWADISAHMRGDRD
jgi:hypothetical protein